MDTIIAMLLVILGIACDRVELIMIALGFSLIATIDLGRFKIHIIHEYKTPTQIINPTLPPEKKSDLRNE